MHIPNIHPFFGLGPVGTKATAENRVPEELLPLPNSEKQEVSEIKLPGSSVKEDALAKNEKKWEELVMKPSPLTLEERMAQVISAEQVRDLLSLIARIPIKEKEDTHSLDVKR